MTEVTIPMHLVQHLDARLDAHEEKMAKMFDAHTVDEMKRYERIWNRIDESDKESNRWRKEFVDSIDCHLEKLEDIEGAFVANKKGKPDYSGHYYAHEEMIEHSNDMRKLIKFVRGVVLSGAVTAVGSWLLYLVWNGILHGPVR